MDKLSFNADGDGTVRVYLYGDTTDFIEIAREAGLTAEHRQEYAFDPDAVAFAVFALAGFKAIGGLSGLGDVIEAYFHRHDGKTVQVKTRTTEVTVTGAKLGDAKALIADALEAEDAHERRGRESLGIAVSNDGEPDQDAPVDKRAAEEQGVDVDENS